MKKFLSCVKLDFLSYGDKILCKNWYSFIVIVFSCILALLIHPLFLFVIVPFLIAVYHYIDIVYDLVDQTCFEHITLYKDDISFQKLDEWNFVRFGRLIVLVDWQYNYVGCQLKGRFINLSHVTIETVISIIKENL